ncbi:DEAD/DEAH box helicase [Streptomyces sp. NPDC051956]|uniref:DEAD/DEAH box helicase n=1 Tax=Streptomyces sp. NPDC051956 TaxID=3365677 RepID=UPI0037CEE442
MPKDPEELYRTLAVTNSGPSAVWGHQQDVLRHWHQKMSDEPDVAIELPTGAGKTLVGGLIGEYRRRKHRERVAYLCPTRQLARQTAAKFDEYGIPNVLLVNPVKTWNQAHQAQYEGARPSPSAFTATSSTRIPPSTTPTCWSWTTRTRPRGTSPAHGAWASLERPRGAPTLMCSPCSSRRWIPWCAPGCGPPIRTALSRRTCTLPRRSV